MKLRVARKVLRRPWHYREVTFRRACLRAGQPRAAVAQVLRTSYGIATAFQPVTVELKNLGRVIAQSFQEARAGGGAPQSETARAERG